jgi:signal transduction histidine kinase
MMNRHIFSRIRFHLRFFIFPAYLGFGVVDWFYSPQYRVFWISMRVLVVILLHVGFQLLKRKHVRDNHSVHIAIAATVLAGWCVAVMVWQSGGVESLYNPGIIIVSVIGMMIFQLSRFHTLIMNIALYLPSTLNALVITTQENVSHTVVILSFFVSTIVVASISKRSEYFSRLELIRARLRLKNESNELSHALMDLQNAQKDLIESSRMAAIGTLAAGVAHEINNAMNFVYQSLPILKNDLANSPKGKDSLEILEVMEEGVRRVVDIVKALRLQTGSGEHLYRRFDPGEAISATQSLLATKLKNKNIDIVVHAPQQSVQSYDGLFNQVITNLISNAVDAMSAVGVADDLIKRQSQQQKYRIEINIHIQNQNLIADVIDNGPGMTADIVEQIFNPFFTTKGPQAGSGLGLYIIKKNINQVGGSISVTSRPGGPTHFHFELPIIEQQEVAS